MCTWTDVILAPTVDEPGDARGAPCNDIGIIFNMTFAVACIYGKSCGCPGLYHNNVFILIHKTKS